MVEKRERLSSGEILKKWIREANYEVLPTEKALSLVDLIPATNSVSVTCRPTGIEETLGFIERLGYEKMKRVWPHVAARRIQSESYFDEVAMRIINSGAEKVFVVGGDGMATNENFTKAEDVLRGFHKRGVSFEKVRVGGYPEGNPVIKEDPIEILLRKQWLAEELDLEMEIVTQMCFDVDTLISWIQEIRERGVYLPVEVGVVGRIKWDTFLKILGTLGIEDVFAFLKSKPKLAASLATGVITGFSPNDFLKELAEKNRADLNIGGISIFTLGNVTSSVKCLTDLAESK